MSYQAFGLRWHSRDLELPELPRGPADSSASEDVQIVEEDPGHWDRPGLESTAWPGLWVKPGLLQLEIKGVGCFRAMEGKHLAWSRCSLEVPDQILRSYLLGSGVGALLIQRGLLVLHGNALEKKGRAIVCVGASGAGKSTLACALMRQGWKLLADDLVALTSGGEVLPGIPRIKLWEDAALAFGLNPLSLPEIHAHGGRRKVVLMGERIERASLSAALEAIYLLSPREGSDLHLQPIDSQKERVMALQGQAFRPAFVRGLGREGANFLAISALQRDVPVLRLSLPCGIEAMEAALRRSLVLGSDGSEVLNSAEELMH